MTYAFPFQQEPARQNENLRAATRVLLPTTNSSISFASWDISRLQVLIYTTSFVDLQTLLLLLPIILIHSFLLGWTVQVTCIQSAQSDSHARSAVIMANRQLYPGDDYSRYGGATSQFPKLGLPVQHTTDLSSSVDYPYTPVSSRHPTITPAASAGVAGGVLPWYDPRGWSLRTKLIVGGVAVAVIVGVVVGAVVGTKRNRYPNYTPLKYRLVDDYSGTSFFDKFDYFSAQDPTDGFVQYVLFYWLRVVCVCLANVVVGMWIRRRRRIST